MKIYVKIDVKTWVRTTNVLQGLYTIGKMQACEWALKKKGGNVVLLAGNGSLANSTVTTRPLTNSTVCMLTVKISRPLRHLYFETSRRCRTTQLIGYHTCMYRVRVRVRICICSQCARNAGCQVIYNPTKQSDITL